ncbi:MAG: DNA repair protein [Acutalibacteraceae bacterium]
MTDKDLKKLSRAELLEMLLTQTKEVKRLSAELDEANRKLQDRRIMLENSGSIAEAALKLNDVFQAAQLAADQYLENVKQLAENSLERKLDDFDDGESKE